MILPSRTQDLVSSPSDRLAERAAGRSYSSAMLDMHRPMILALDGSAYGLKARPRSVI